VKNSLIVGAGGNFGSSLVSNMHDRGINTYTITSGTSTDNKTLTVDWTTCNITDFERFLKTLPVLDYIIFNQNSPALTDSCLKFKSDHIFEIWKRSKQWTQSHFVNCILPLYILQTLASKDHISNQGCITWMLSSAMFFTDTSAPIDYAGQKYQNYLMLQKLAQNNPQEFVGVCPGLLTEQNCDFKSQLLIDFLQTENKSSGKFYVIKENLIEQHK
jgi:hypothetical protein